jgi:tetratricopeptide (TPR) repeat protein
VLIPSRPYLEFREAFRRGDGDAVLGTGQLVLDQLGGDERQAELVPAVLLMVGATLARLERFADATAYLDRGLALLPGTAATHEVGDGDWYALLLLDLLMATGRYRESWGRIQDLIEPDRDPRTRLGATRAQLALYTAFGDFETAQQLLNTAAGLADRVGSNQLAAMVDGDRAIVLATQGRTVEAAVFADQVLPQLGRAGTGPLMRWSGAAAATVTTTVARHAAAAGDLMTAERMLFLATEPAEGTGRTFDAAQLQLARGVVWREAGRTVDAERPLLDARQGFLALGCAPAAALAQREEARLAMVKGMSASSRPLYERAREEFALLGLTREVTTIDAILRTAPA